MRDLARTKERLAVGLMAGTSLDAVDGALVAIRGAGDDIQIRRVGFVSKPYPSAVRARILRIAAGQPVTAGEISQLNFLLGELFAEAALAVCRRARISPTRLAVIGSHGQTVFHQGLSQSKRALPSTLQIAEPGVIAERTRAPVIADFRVADVAAGGEGAPLVPLVDFLLLRDARAGVVALNLGGIANVTVLPAGASRDRVFGFDTGPGNIVMDGLVRHSTRGRRGFDADGAMAARGQLLDGVLQAAMRFPFFSRKPPKSAGREQFGEEFLKRYFLSHRGKPCDLLRTAAELTAQTVADALRRFVLGKARIERLIVSGGGVENAFLLERLGALLPELVVMRSDAYGLPAREKESIAFAILADRRMQGLAGNLPRVTGARRAVALGKFVCP